MTFLAESLLAAGGGTSAVYVEDVFVPYLYTGTGSSQTITTNINTSGLGGLIWIKGRSGATTNRLTDTVRGATKELVSSTTAAEVTNANGLTAFGGSGFTIGTDAAYNTNTATYVSWNFRKAAKFFDVVTYTGTGVNRTVAHNLGSVPGCIIVKRTDTISAWQVYHNSLANTEYLVLNTTAAKATGTTRWNSTTPTSTDFTVGTDTTVNASGGTYVAYLFAHNAGGFGLAGTDNVISCGSFTTDASGNATVNLGYEPQWLLTKSTSAGAALADWTLIDTMRGFPTSGTTNWLYADLGNAEATANTTPSITSTGFSVAGFGATVTYAYVSIRRGPMKVPTTGTSVFSAVLETPIAGNTTVTAGFTVDSALAALRAGGSNDLWQDRLRGGSQSPLYWSSLFPQAINNEQTGSAVTGLSFQNNTAIVDVNYLNNDRAWTTSTIWWLFGRAPNYFDTVCYTGTGANATVTHNLKAVPELMIVKRKTGGTDNWAVYSSALANTEYLVLNTTAAKATGTTWWNSTTPTSSVFSVGTSTTTNASASTYVAQLFATCTGVSKVGSYTGTATTKQVDCGFSAGARFVMIKRTDSTGDWYVWDSTRGIVAGNDPYLLLNSTAAEVTTTDYIDTYSAGFEISSTAPVGINASGGTYIFLAIA